MNVIKRLKYKYLKGILIRKGAMVYHSSLGQKSQVAPNAFVSNSVLGDFTSVGRNTTVIHAELGRFCSVSWNCTIGATSHRYDHLSTHAFPYVKEFGFAASSKRINEKTIVGNDVWIGAGAIIMPGISIGDGAVIGAGSVVTKNVLPFEIVVGVPAKKINTRFKPEIIEQILANPWWNWEQDKIKNEISIFQKKFEGFE